jgi:uncharacterized membrane protein
MTSWPNVVVVVFVSFTLLNFFVLTNLPIELGINQSTIVAFFISVLVGGIYSIYFNWLSSD